MEITLELRYDENAVAYDMFPNLFMGSPMTRPSTPESAIEGEPASAPQEAAEHTSESSADEDDMPASWVERAIAALHAGRLPPLPTSTQRSPSTIKAGHRRAPGSKKVDELGLVVVLSEIGGRPERFKLWVPLDWDHSGVGDFLRRGPRQWMPSARRKSSKTST